MAVLIDVVVFVVVKGLLQRHGHLFVAIDLNVIPDLIPERSVRISIGGRELIRFGQSKLEIDEKIRRKSIIVTAQIKIAFRRTEHHITGGNESDMEGEHANLTQRSALSIFVDGRVFDDNYGITVDEEVIDAMKNDPIVNGILLGFFSIRCRGIE